MTCCQLGRSIYDLMLVELVTLFSVIRTAGAPTVRPLSPVRVAVASSEDEAPDRYLRLCVLVSRSPHVDGPALDPCGDNGKVSVVQCFDEAFKGPLQWPLIVSPPRLCISKDFGVADDEDIVPKRSAHLACSSGRD